NPSFFGDVGPLAAPDDYTATLYSTVDGKTRELTKPANFKVKPLFTETVAGGVSPKKRSALLRQVEDLRREVSTATSQINDLNGQLKSFRIALDRSSAVTGDLESKYHQMRMAVFAAEEVLFGQRSRDGMHSAPANVSGRLFMIEFARANTWGLTSTQKQQMVYVKDALNLLQPKLEHLIQTEFPQFRHSLLKAGAPWVPEGLMEETSDEHVEID
ncbi:MAG: hypothetical protein ACPGJI_04015, partial [Kangiellaceae bacterium]